MADRRLQVFHAVAKHQSFTKAAEALFMTQPAVTFQIKQLEEYFNIRLFDRGPGHISLTAAGSIVFEYAERILALSSELDLRMKDLAGPGRRTAAHRGEHDDRGLSASPGAGRIQRPLSRRGAPTPGRQLGNGAGPDRRTQSRYRFHRGRIATAFA